MTVTNPSNYVKDTDSWVHSTFIVSLGNDGSGNPLDYTTYTQIVTNNCKDELFGPGGTSALDPNMASILSGPADGSGALPVYFSHRKCRDTSLGGNDAINCYYQYNETDDPPHPFTMSETQTSTGMGRVHSETIDDHQQIIYLTFGLPVFNNLAEFYQQAVDAKVAELVNTGTSVSLLDKLTAMAGATITTIVNLPSLPNMWLNYILRGVITTPITKYYDFSNQMGQYYKYVQTILSQLSVNMGFMNDATLLGLANGVATGTGGVASDMTGDEQAERDNATGVSDAGLPDMFRTYHMDIYQIMRRRASFLSKSGLFAGSKNLTTDQLVAQQAQETYARNQNQSTIGKYVQSMIAPISDATSGFADTIYNAMLYIGFRVEKSTESSEAISNQIGQPAIANFINSKTQAARDVRFSTMYGNSNIPGLDGISKFLGDAAGALSHSQENSQGVEGLTALATGSGMVDIPDVWKDSSISKNYSFNLRLRSPYGDPLSIMQTLYVPLAMILAGAMPRAIGASAYSTPFICRVYCKGMFAVPLGMIESVNIKRGSDVNGWNYQRLPTEIDINFTIKDLSPCMYMALGDLTSKTALTQDSWNYIYGTNSSFQEYLLTLSGMGLAERSLWILNFKRKIKLLTQTLFDTRLNPNYWMMEVGQSVPARVITAIIPTTKIPTN